MRILVFTDLDGTLLDRKSYSWSGAQPALAELLRQRVPVILCTSKTRAEVRHLRNRIGNRDPYIVENGGMVVLPRGYFKSQVLKSGGRRETVIRMGGDYGDVVRALKRLARSAGVKVRGFSDMTAAEVSEATGLSLAEARLARRRESGEPFRFQNATEPQIRKFARLAAQEAFTLQRGGRFWHFSAGCDKGQAMATLTHLYRVAGGEPTKVIALGDAANDLPMLKRADFPILLAGPDGHFDSVVTRAMPRIRRVPDTSAAAWGNAVLDAVQQCETTPRDPAHSIQGKARAAAGAVPV